MIYARMWEAILWGFILAFIEIEAEKVIHSTNKPTTDAAGG